MEDVYLLCAALVVMIGGGWIMSGSAAQKGIRFKRSFALTARNTLQALRDDGYDEVFEKAGLHLSVAKYTAIRNMLALLLICWLIGVSLSAGTRAALAPGCLTAVLYFLSAPKEYRGKAGKKTVFKLVLDKLREAYLAKRDEELMAIITQFKNMIVTQSQFAQARSAESIVESLLRFTTDLTRPIFAQTLSLMRLAQADEAAKYFGSHFGTRIGDEFAAILHKLDVLEPEEFLLQINAFQDGLREEKQTRRQKKQEQAGRMIFVLACCVISVVMFDYMYILFGYLMENMIF